MLQLQSGNREKLATTIGLFEEANDQHQGGAQKPAKRLRLLVDIHGDEPHRESGR